MSNILKVKDIIVARPMNRFLAKAQRLLLAISFISGSTTPAQAQITFSEKTPELAHLEEGVNDCAARQQISTCHAALSQTHILQISHADSEESADRIMRNAAMLLPLYMLGELYDRKGRENVACGYARSGERQLHRLLKEMDALMGKDPDAFKNVEKTKHGLQEFQVRFDNVLAGCEE